MSEKKVVVYGASGYTGRLICEYLREYNVPFVAAGRSQEKLESSLAHNVAGVETADYEIRTVDHDVESLAELFDGASVVCNTVGPFSTLGPDVVEAALKAGVHYTDTTGEQDWLMGCDDEWGAKFADAGLLLAPGIAQMYTTGEIAAQLCLEKPGLDTLDIAVFWGGSPTIASTETILVNAAFSARTSSSRTRTSPSTPGRAWSRWSCPASTSWRSPCRGAARRTPCGSSGTRAWPTARRRAGCSTPPSCTACRRSWPARSRRPRT